MEDRQTDRERGTLADGGKEGRNKDARADKAASRAGKEGEGTGRKGRVDDGNNMSGGKQALPSWNPEQMSSERAMKGKGLGRRRRRRRCRRCCRGLICEMMCDTDKARQRGGGGEIAGGRPRPAGPVTETGKMLSDTPRRYSFRLWGRRPTDRQTDLATDVMSCSPCSRREGGRRQARSPPAMHSSSRASGFSFRLRLCQAWHWQAQAEGSDSEFLPTPSLPLPSPPRLPGMGRRSSSSRLQVRRSGSTDFVFRMRTPNVQTKHRASSSLRKCGRNHDGTVVEFPLSRDCKEIAERVSGHFVKERVGAAKRLCRPDDRESAKLISLHSHVRAFVLAARGRSREWKEGGKR